MRSNQLDSTFDLAGLGTIREHRRNTPSNAARCERSDWPSGDRHVRCKALQKSSSARKEIKQLNKYQLRCQNLRISYFVEHGLCAVMAGVPLIDERNPEPCVCKVPSGVTAFYHRGSHLSLRPCHLVRCPTPQAGS